MTMQEHKTLAAALVAAQSAAESVGKDATNKFHNYKYASAEAIMVEARAALNSAGLATLMEQWELLPPTHDGAPERVKVQFLTLHANSDQTLKGVAEYFVLPEKGRPEDKATATALTYAEGYYLRGLLCLPRVEEGSEVDERNDKDREPGPRRPANGHSKPKGDPQATARAEYQAKLLGLSKEKIVDALKAFDTDDGAARAAEKFGKDGAVEMREATVKQLYKTLELAIGGLSTYAVTVEWEAWCAKNADQFLSDEQKQLIEARLERQRNYLKEELEKAQRQTA